MTVLAIAQAAAQRLQITSPTTFYGSTNNDMILLNALLIQTLKDVSSEFPWPELTKIQLFLSIANMEAYPLPQDFDRIQSETWWNRTERWPLIGPLTGVEWETYKSGLIVSLPRQRFRPRSWDNSQFFIDPTPSATELLGFEYISQTMIRPKTWVANTAYTQNTYVSYDGLILKCLTAGTSDTKQPPEFGRDGTCFWKSIPAYVASISYYVDQYVYANSKVYKCTVAGKGGVAPSHTSGSATTGTCTFLYISTPSAWVAGTSYTGTSSNTGTFDTVTATAGADCFMCVNSGTSGDYSPKFRSALTDVNYILAPTTDTITDGTAIWTVQYAPFIAFQADTDEVILNNAIITNELVWRFKMERGLPFENLKEFSDAQKDIAKSKLIGGGVLDIANRNTYPPILGILNYPDGNYGT